MSKRRITQEHKNNVYKKSKRLEDELKRLQEEYQKKHNELYNQAIPAYLEQKKHNKQLQNEIKCLHNEILLQRDEDAQSRNNYLILDGVNTSLMVENARHLDENRNLTAKNARLLDEIRILKSKNART